MTKLNFQHQLLQSLVSHCPSEIILICWFGPKETLINNNAENSCIALSFCGQYVLGPWPFLFITDLLKLRKVCKNFITVHITVYYISFVSQFVCFEMRCHTVTFLQYLSIIAELDEIIVSWVEEKHALYMDGTKTGNCSLI